MELMCDNNVLLDFVLQREPFCQDAGKLLAAAAFGDVHLSISTTMLTDVFYVLRKAYGNHFAYESLEEILRFIGLCSTNAALFQSIFLVSRTP